MVLVATSCVAGPACNPARGCAYIHMAVSAARLLARARVDVSGLLSGASKTHRAASVAQIRAAMVGPDSAGFFIADNVPKLADEPYLAKIYEFAAAAHALPVEVKQRFLGQGGSARAGATYSGSDAGQSEHSYDPTTVATARSWDYARAPSPSGTGSIAASSELAPVMPPPYDYVTVLDELYSLQNVVSSAVLEGVAEALGEPRDCFSRHIGHGDMGTIRLISYPGSDDPSVADADVGIAPHTDFEAFTLMHQTSPGLQFLHQGGDAGGVDEWIEAPVGPFCVIIGDVLERFTNGLLRATPHRVLRTAAPRMSLIRFNAVAPETLITPLPAFVSEVRPPSYTPVTMRRHMETTLGNLDLGLGSWDAQRQRSLSATYQYD